MLGKGQMMKRTRALLLFAAIAVGSLAGTSAWADRGHFRGPAPRYYGYHYRYYDPWIGLGTGLLFGSALYWAATRPPPAVYVAPEPVVVVPPPQATGGEWWYYCRAAGAYYPYVQQCPTGWERVPPHPAE